MPEPLEDATVPLGVALGEVVVDGHEVDALADRPAVVGRHRRQRVQIEREARDEGLALAGLHLGDVALVEDDPAHQLHVEHPLVRLAQARLAYRRIGLEEQVVEGLAVLEPLPELDRLRAQLVVRERPELGLERGDVGGLLWPGASCAGPRRSEVPSRAFRRPGPSPQGTRRRSPGQTSRLSERRRRRPPRARRRSCGARTTWSGRSSAGIAAERALAVDEQGPLAADARRARAPRPRPREARRPRSSGRRPPRGRPPGAPPPRGRAAQLALERRRERGSTSSGPSSTTRSPPGSATNDRPARPRPPAPRP